MRLPTTVAPNKDRYLHLVKPNIARNVPAARPPYMTTQPQHPFFSSSSSMPILDMPLGGPPAPDAPVYDDISLLYLRISRTMS